MLSSNIHKIIFKWTPKKDVLYIIGDWNAKVGSKEIPGVIGQVWPWNTKWSTAKANRVCQENMLVTVNLFPKPRELLHTWTSPDR